MRNSVFGSFFRVFFGVLGLGLAVFVSLFIFGFLSRFSSEPIEPNLMTSPVIYRDALGAHKFDQSSPIILRLNIQGIIGVGDLRAEPMREMLNASREGFFQGRTKAILLKINSPGGLASESYAIYEMLMQYKKKFQVPIYAHINGLCASGGMMIACSADKILSNPSGIIGSVGVIMGPAFNFYDLMQKYGVQSKTLTAGKDKDALSPVRKWGPDEGSFIQKSVDSEYNLFLNIVTKARPRLSRDALIHEYGANIFSPNEALEHGYIDGVVGNYESALMELAHEAKLEGPYQVLGIRIRRSALGGLLEALSGQSNQPGYKITHQIQSVSSLPEELQTKPCYLYMPALSSH